MTACLRLLLPLMVVLLVGGKAFAEEKSSTDRARDALAQQGEDESETAQLEEVFQAAEKTLFDATVWW